MKHNKDLNLLKIKVKNEEETLALAESLARQLHPSSVVRLEGTLGAGKTTFTKGLARGLNIQRVIKSPTYTIIREYTQGALPLYHIDLYRLEDGGTEDLGLEEYLYGDGVTVIEWGSVAEEEMPEEYLMVKLNLLDDPGQREIEFQAKGQVYQELLEKLDI